MLTEVPVPIVEHRFELPSKYILFLTQHIQGSFFLLMRCKLMVAKGQWKEP